MKYKAKIFNIKGNIDDGFIEALSESQSLVFKITKSKEINCNIEEIENYSTINFNGDKLINKPQKFHVNIEFDVEEIKTNKYYT